MVAFEVATRILLCQNMSLFSRLRISTWLCWLYEPWLIFVARKILLSNATLDSAGVNAAFCTMDLISFITGRLYLTCKLVARHWILGWCHNWLSASFACDVLHCCSCVSRSNFAYRVVLLFRSRLLLTFFAISASWFFFRWNWGLLSSPFNSFLNSRGVLGTTLLGVSVRAADFVVIAKNMPHALFYLWLAESWHAD